MEQDPDLHTWLDFPANKGKATWLAEQLGCTKAAVSFWRDDGVPLHRIPEVSRVLGGAVSEAAMLRHAMARKVAKQKEQQPEAQDVQVTGPGALDEVEAR